MTNEEVQTDFRNWKPNIIGNVSLREPQIEAYVAIHRHFVHDRSPCYVQLPVGSGKTGLMGITPLGLSDGRVLMIAPNLTIRKTIMDELNISDPQCFYYRRGVLIAPQGPFVSELKTGANIRDCDDAHIVVANIQQFAGNNNRWYEQFDSDYFQMILVDEGHHNVAATWQRLFDYFQQARVISYTATPLRSDGRTVLGTHVYSFPYTRSMIMGYISPVDAVYVAPSTVTFTAKGKTETLSLEQVINMRERDWFSKGIALSDTCNRSIVQASIRQLNEVRKHGSPRTIIAVACSIRHAVQVATIYREYGLRTEVLHSQLTDEEKARIEASLRIGESDVVVQVQMLAEGYDLRSLSVAAVFRPFRSLSPYIQFVGRVLRLANPETPLSPGNKVYVVSHIGLNDERWWTDFTNFDRSDQMFFSEYLAGAGATQEGDAEIEAGIEHPRLTLRPFMRVLSETIEKYLQSGYLSKVDATLVSEVLQTIREKGFDPLEFGLTEEVLRRRLELTSQQQVSIEPFNLKPQPQKIREALRQRVAQEARSIADTVLNRLGVPHVGNELCHLFPGRGSSNAAVLIALAQSRQNEIMGIGAREREKASREQLQAAIDTSPDIADKLTAFISRRLKDRNGTA